MSAPRRCRHPLPRKGLVTLAQAPLNTSMVVVQARERHTYLARFPPPLIVKLFQKGVEEHLGCVLTSMEQGWQDNEDELDAVAGWLVTLPKTFRFELAVGFLTDAERNAAKALFERALALEDKENKVGATWTAQELTAARDTFML